MGFLCLHCLYQRIHMFYLVNIFFWNFWSYNDKFVILDKIESQTDIWDACSKQQGTFTSTSFVVSAHNSTHCFLIIVCKMKPSGLITIISTSTMLLCWDQESFVTLVGSFSIASLDFVSSLCGVLAMWKANLYMKCSYSWGIHTSFPWWGLSSFGGLLTKVEW